MSKLSPNLVEVIAKTTLEYLDKEKLKQQKSKRDRRLRNTKLLLKHYRAFKDHCEDVGIELEELNNPDFLEDLDTDEFAVQAIRRSKERTLAMVRFIERMLEIYQISSERSKNPVHYRQFKTMKDLYISDEEITVEQIAEKNDIDIRTVYRDIQESVQTLSALIFGVDGVRMID